MAKSESHSSSSHGLSRRKLLQLAGAVPASQALMRAAEPEYRSAWLGGIERPWPGPEFWSNPLQDWRVSRGRLECFAAGGDRNVFLLTREISSRSGGLETSVTVGRLEEDTGPLKEGFAGFRVGIRGHFRDYRDSAVRGNGLDAGLTTEGRLFIGDPQAGHQPADVKAPLDGVRLRLKATPVGDSYTLELEASKADRVLAKAVRERVPAEWLTGGVALVCSSGAIRPSPQPVEIIPGFGAKAGTGRGGTLRCWFQDWRVSGSKVTVHEDRAFGPIMFAMHTLHRRVMKMTAQMAPLGERAGEVALDFQPAGSREWKTVMRAAIDPLSRTATFRIPGWDDTRDVPYRLVYELRDNPERPRRFTYGGVVRKDPVTKPEIVVAAFTGNNDFGFPHADIVRNVSRFRPDLLFFTGDNIYERVGEYGTQRAPMEAAALDYLRKWYIFGWEYSELLKDIPTACLPDDHDVYHGNIWGEAGRHAEGSGYEGQDKGGYTMPAEWVNAVQRTQTSHLPDPADPTPVEQDITVYYTHLLYGGLSVAIIEDRKWKSAPKGLLPKAQITNGWPQNPAYNAATDGDLPGADLLGPRQEAFLESWAADWSGGAWMKTVVSQTIFANLATLPKGVNTDAVTPKLRVMKPGEYAEGEAPVMDHDSNSWPQTPRNRALRAMRKGLAFHIAGDQHLASTIQYGVENWNDAGWAICVPSVANVWPRRWYPEEPGRNRKPGAPAYTGEFLDGFGNKMTVHAVANPTARGVEPASLHDRAPGYGIITFQRATRRIVLANWPRWVEASQPGAAPYEGWPITIHQSDNGLPRTGWTLDPVKSPGLKDPVVQVARQDTGEVIYTLRIQGERFTPPVFEAGTYTVKVFDPDKKVERIIRDQVARKTG